MLRFTLSGNISYTETQITDNSNRYQNLQEFISHIYIHNYTCNKLMLFRYLVYGTELILIKKLILVQILN